ncbi:PEP-CTERM sorting domain-containing protein [Nostoc sp. CHAB 5784]|uniref:PEP-CTERM sorting domain-containing protein n=1 Tax=Nostoc mirabile TaxID=2907820 RepID=UPI001E4E8767|nr:PEP-CTERM sorting domain-containing protein [Nostoc mirabile]MCC5666491.1 PEP-CTERM sorting domain-containing protein [Nostoc mirabile CHAB5784]
MVTCSKYTDKETFSQIFSNLTMHTYNPLIILGLTTTVLVSAPLAAHAESKVYKFVSGYESIRLNTSTLEELESLGLSLTSVENTAVPAPGYTYGLKYVPSPLGNDFNFSYDELTNEFESISGTVDLTGSIFFDVDTTKLNLPPQLELGDLFAEPALDFNVTDTVTTGLPIFTLVGSAPTNVDLQNQTVRLNFDAFITQEFSDFLVAAGATKQIAGLKLAEIQGDRTITQVPEPGTALAILMAASAALGVRRRRSSSAL